MVKNNSDSKWVFNKLGNTIIYHYERNHLTSGHLGRYITKALTYIFLFNLAFVFLYPRLEVTQINYRQLQKLYRYFLLKFQLR